jgi:hypothetical protein
VPLPTHGVNVPVSEAAILADCLPGYCPPAFHVVLDEAFEAIAHLLVVCAPSPGAPAPAQKHVAFYSMVTQINIASAQDRRQRATHGSNTVSS